MRTPLGLVRVAAVAALAFASLAAQADTVVVATVGRSQISIEQFSRVLAEMRRSGDMGASLKTMRPEGRAEVLDAMIAERLFALAARETGLDRRPDVQAELEEAANRILARRYSESALEVSDAAAREYYGAHPDAFRTPRRAKARHILLGSEADAKAVLSALNAGATFEALAAERSLEPGSAAKGGELGWIPHGVMVAPFEEAMFALQPGQTSGVVKTNFGFHVIRVDEIDVEALPPFEAVRDQARQAVAEAELARLRRQLTTRHPVSINRDALARMGR
jgi:peptidyl-prolyl cis-trans isomerase C